MAVGRRATRVLDSAARLQQLVPDAVLVVGRAAAWHAGHRISFDHDHVLTDLNQRFDAVLDALEADPDFVLNRAAHGKMDEGGAMLWGRVTYPHVGYSAFRKATRSRCSAAESRVALT